MTSEPLQRLSTIVIILAATCLLSCQSSAGDGPTADENAFKLDDRGLSIHERQIDLLYPPDATLAAMGKKPRKWEPPPEVPTNRIYIFDDWGVSLYEPVDNPDKTGLRLAVQFLPEKERKHNTRPVKAFEGRIWITGASIRRNMRRSEVGEVLAKAKVSFEQKTWGYEVKIGSMSAKIFFAGAPLEPAPGDLLKTIEISLTT